MEGEHRAEVSNWWRFSQYEIRDGAIQPAEGATLEGYDPWAEYEASRLKGSGSAEPPYQSLARLVQQASFTVDGLLRPESEEAVLDWCSRYGLLGIVPQQFDSLPGDTDDVQNDDGPIFHHRFTRNHYWGSTGWESTSMSLPVIGRFPPGEGGNMPAVAPGRVLRRYFPADQSLDYPEIPPPASADFWTIYREPVRDFIRRAIWINDALTGLSSVPPSVQHQVSSGLGRPDLDAM